MKLFIFQNTGYLYPFVHKIGKARGAKLPPKLVVPGVFAYMKPPLETGLF